jgi:hypothetical protein
LKYTPWDEPRVPAAVSSSKGPRHPRVPEPVRTVCRSDIPQQVPCRAHCILVTIQSGAPEFMDDVSKQICRVHICVRVDRLDTVVMTRTACLNINKLYTLLTPSSFTILIWNSDNFPNSINQLCSVVEIDFVLYEVTTGLTGWPL